MSTLLSDQTLCPNVVGAAGSVGFSSLQEMTQYLATTSDPSVGAWLVSSAYWGQKWGCCGPLKWWMILRGLKDEGLHHIPGTSWTNPAHQETAANEIMRRQQSEWCQMRNEQISKNRWRAMMPLLDNYTPIRFACVSSFPFDSVEINRKYHFSSSDVGHLSQTKQLQADRT